MGTTETFLVYQKIIFELVVPSQPDPLFETRGATHCFYNTCWGDPLFFTTPLILSKPDRLNGSKSQEFNLEFRNSVF